ncbi:stalk domain-containing protein [Tissierella sp. Yu-01]|uniref:stalk domain-containing protein n=1 Tax=Tissierella sp. Yu-01 TaxID=3035694 RepID=UPI00240E28CD|nr:stalk domain-containing protein [Tissierella sp. Yu-01]WFA09582.1 stalk domain-containing protein [Tissierella sp. Yu-01]
MKKTSKILALFLMLILLFSTVVSAEATNVKIFVNGTELIIPREYGYPFIDNQSRTMVPLRIISEKLGHKVKWDASTQTATIDVERSETTRSDGEISVTIGEKKVKTAKGEITMDTVAILKDSRTHVPLRFVVEALGYEVTYDGPKNVNGYQHMVNIKGGNVELPKPTEPTQPTKPSVGHDLENTPINSKNVKVDFEPIGNQWNLDFYMTYKPWADDLQKQYDDAERLLKARFGNNSTVNEVIAYMRSNTNLKEEVWEINGQTVRVQSNPHTVGSVGVWRTN